MFVQNSLEKRPGPAETLPFAEAEPIFLHSGAGRGPLLARATNSAPFLAAREARDKISKVTIRFCLRIRSRLRPLVAKSRRWINGPVKAALSS